jgi:hypothetical protein
MAQFTRSAAEQFRPEETSVGWLWNIFVFSLVIFGSTVLLFLGMEFGYKAFLQKQIESLQSEIDSKKGQISAENQKKLGEFYSQVYNINQVLSSHLLATPLFKFLEENTNTSIVYSKFSYTKSPNAVSVLIDGEAPSLDIIAKQLQAFKERPEVKQAILTNASSDQGKIRFNMNVTLNLNFLKG